MHDYLFDVEVVRLSVIVGVIVTMLFYERVQLTTGGVIVPGYLALFIPQPHFILMTMVTAWLTWLIVNRVIARRYILYARRKYEIEILTALSLTAVWFGIAQFLIGIDPFFEGLLGIGFIVPAILAHDMFRQGVRQTTVAVLVNTAIIGLFVFVFYTISRITPGYEHEQITGFATQGLGYPPGLLFPAVFASVLAGMLVFGRLGLRTGGFVVGAYLALVLLHPLDLLFAIGVAVVTWVVVTKVLTNYMLVFGRRKLGVMTLTAAILAWSAEIVITGVSGGAYHPWAGFHVITLMVPALIANDIQRQGVLRTIWGTAIVAVAVFTTMNLVAAAWIMAGVS